MIHVSGGRENVRARPHAASVDLLLGHAIVAVLFVAAMLAHIYIGTIGMEGAFEAMGSGTVDVNWAREHHSLWVEEKMGPTGATEPPRQPIARPAE